MMRQGMAQLISYKLSNVNNKSVHSFFVEIQSNYNFKVHRIFDSFYEYF